MVVTVEDLAIELRLPDTLDAPQTSVLTRLIGVGEAFVDLLISGAPLPIQEEVIIRLGAYLYEQPTSGRRDSYSNSWVNSGAGALASRWLTQTIAGETGGVIPLPPTSGGVTVERVETLIGAALAAFDPGVGAPVLTATIPVLTAQLKNLDTDYIELLPAPGIGQYLQILQVWIHKLGDDDPLETLDTDRSVAGINSYGEYGLLIVSDDSLPKPWGYWTGNYESVWVSNFADLLRLPDSSFRAGVIGGHGLSEDAPLVLGFTPGLNGDRYYTPEGFDAFIAPVNDAILTLFVRYAVHSIYDFNR